ncbi:MAG: hypothetical protein QM734_07080 [Cyclobacteriaceae bacterium]
MWLWINRAACFFIFTLSARLTLAQELYPLNEPASSVPKSVVGVRVFTQNYKDLGYNRSLKGIRVMYGLTSKLSIIAVASISNHHRPKLPVDLIYHFKRARYLPYTYNGTYLFAKYRFISIDRKYSHLRITAYGEWSNVSVAHEEAEPNLMDDTGGYGYGIITTWLKNRFAASLTYGYIKPNPYSETQVINNGNTTVSTKFWYGDAVKYNLSLGYRVAPAHYKDYDQPNLNIYLEFMGKTYGSARIVQNGQELSINSPVAGRLWGSYYIEAHPGIQYIVKSNLRFDLSMGFSVVGLSYEHFAPMTTFGIQRYFYRPEKKKT